ncbi:hypothetical protein M8C21_023589 [Ambrosia artemisiifolia]|uniref:Uncharacterized protein n=1 Tax=Ambrosia artemisiifolia TaxID=4212 RepID=A0AAD5BZH8_AMBAR|nr:hypothetical protein M8C21_023589 [Ambrosia artemisiifolia]
MAHSNKQTEFKSTEKVNGEMRRSFSWDRAFFTSDGFLDADELSGMIEGGDDDVKQQLQKIEEIESLEAKLFEEMEASTRASKVSSSRITLSSGKKDSQAKMEKAASGGSRGKKVKSPARRNASFKTDIGEGDSSFKTSAGIKKRNSVVPVGTRVSRTPPASLGSSGSSFSTFSVDQRSKRSISVPRRSLVNSEKLSAIDARRNDECKIQKNKVTPANAGISRTSPAGLVSSSGSSLSTFSHNPRSRRSSSVPRRSSLNREKSSAIDARRNGEWKPTKNKVVSVSKSRTLPASLGSSSSTLSVNQRSKRSSSVPRRSSMNSEKPSAINARRNDEWKINKPEVRLIPKTQSSIGLKIKPPPVVSHPSSPTELFNSSSSSRAQRSSSSASSASKVNQRSKPVGRSKSALKHRPTVQIPDQNGKQSVASSPETRSPNALKTRKLLAPKTAAAVDAGLKPISYKTATTKLSRKQSSTKAKSSSSVPRGAESIILVSPEVMDIKGKLNALKMEINMQKKERCKETK